MISRATIAAASVVAALALGACRTQRTPTGTRAKPPAYATLEVLRMGGATALQPYLDLYPLGDAGARVDLLAQTDERSMHLVQTRRGVPRHYHPKRTETVYVLRGTGVCYVGDRSYPVTPGATFKIAPGVPHSVTVDGDDPIVAIAYFEPPLGDADDRVLVE